MASVPQQPEDQFRGLLEAAPDAMVIVNQAGSIVLVNTQTERLFGFSREELLGKPIEVLIPARFHAHHGGHRDGYFQELIKTSPPDLILMDIALPGMDGLTLTRQIKANGKTHDVVVVALTAFAMKGDDEKARAAGCDGYITKPIDTRKLPGYVAECLGRRGAGRPV